jgi:tRNA (mo5U34)-methyltransferase
MVVATLRYIHAQPPSWISQLAPIVKDAAGGMMGVRRETGQKEEAVEKEELHARVREIQWFHNWELLPGIMTDGWGAMSERLHHFQIPEDLSGKRVLDIGCADGYFSFLAESRGAEVVSIDAWPREGYFLAHQVLDSQAKFHHMSVYDINADALGTFDVVFFFGVYYHLKHPLLALERIASVTRDFALIESEVIDLPLSANEGVSRFYEFSELNNDPTNWWAPNIPCLLQTVRASGFPRAELVGRYSAGHRAIVRAEKGPRTAGKALTENIFLMVDSPLQGAQVAGVVPVSGWTLNQLAPDEGIECITIYLDRLDDPAFALGEAEYHVPREDLAPRMNPIYGDVGFQFLWDVAEVVPGQHALYVLVEGRGHWQYASVPIIVGAPAGPAPLAKGEQNREIPAEAEALRQILAERDAEIVRLRGLVAGYERGRFIRLMKWLQDLRSGK